MAIAHFPSLASAETVEVTFDPPTGAERTFRLLVDSGFTGQSSFVLPDTASNLAHAQAAASQVTGALQGTQQRVVVSCRVPAVAFQSVAIAILADVSGLALPPGIDGLTGLRFLRHFRRWGSERADTGGWNFYLETDGP
jgi:predicted aspartyl protease